MFTNIKNAVLAYPSKVALGMLGAFLAGTTCNWIIIGAATVIGYTAGDILIAAIKGWLFGTQQS